MNGDGDSLLEICEGVTFLQTHLIHAYSYEKHDANRKMGKRHELGNKGKNTHCQVLPHVQSS